MTTASERDEQGRRVGKADRWWQRVHKGLAGKALPPLLLIVAGVAVYANSFDGVFLYDDQRHIVKNVGIHRLWPPWHLLTRRRPVVEVSLAVNYAIDGLNPRGYHAFNLAVHILAALALYGVLWRTLSREPFRARFQRNSRWLALSVALLWLVHPLQTQSVTYLIQRGESMMGLCYLLTLYCVIRGAHALHPRSWYAAAVVVCALGMGSKAVMITAPLVVFLYDRAFLAPSLREAIRARFGLYMGLIATWGLLFASGVVQGVLDPARTSATIGLGYHGASPWTYAATQPGVIFHYLRLSLWPRPLCLDYALPFASTAVGVLVPAIGIVGLLVGTVWALFRRAWPGVLGAWFFVILAPTSSVIPIQDAVYEHRMYLSLAAVVALFVVGGEVVLTRFLSRLFVREPLRRWLAVGLVAMVAAVLGLGTFRRHEAYQSLAAMWADVVARAPHNPRAHYNLGNALGRQADNDAAIRHYREALRLNPRFALAHNNLGNALLALGETGEAMEHFVRCMRLDPTFPEAYNGLGAALLQQGRFSEAAKAFRKAGRIAPKYAPAHLNLGNALARLGRTEEAANAYRLALRLDPALADAHYGLGEVLRSSGRLDQAIQSFRDALRIDPDHALARRALRAATAASRHDSPD